MIKLIKNKNANKVEVRCNKTMELLGWVDKIHTEQDYIKLASFHLMPLSESLSGSNTTNCKILTLEVHRRPFYYFTCSKRILKGFIIRMLVKSNE